MNLSVCTGAVDGVPWRMPPSDKLDSSSRADRRASWSMDTPCAALTYDATGCCWHIMCSVATCMLVSCMKVACLLWADVSTSIDWISCLARLAMLGEIFVAVQ